MKRQAIRVNIKKIHEIYKQMVKERDDLKKELRIDMSLDNDWILPIINKTPECSDTWEFE